MGDHGKRKTPLVTRQMVFIKARMSTGTLKKHIESDNATGAGLKTHPWGP